MSPFTATAICCCLAAVLLQLLVLPAQGHMVMIEPQSRQWLDYTLRYNYNPHAVNAGGNAGTQEHFADTPFSLISAAAAATVLTVACQDGSCQDGSATVSTSAVWS